MTAANEYQSNYAADADKKIAATMVNLPYLNYIGLIM